MGSSNEKSEVCPEMLIDLLKHTGKPFYEYYASLNPYANAEYSVAWAGENQSANWMHIAREYTEKFLHQQQIRDATNKQGIMTKDTINHFWKYVCTHYHTPFEIPKQTRAAF